MRQVIAILSALLMAVAGYGALGTTGIVEKTTRPSFEIPASIVSRMYDAYDADVARTFNQKGDLVELRALARSGVTNVAEIIARPRPVLRLYDDGLADTVREKLWPIDVAPFERTLAARMEVDTNGIFRLREKDGTSLPTYPTFRQVNSEIETWAIAQLDKHYTRMDPQNRDWPQIIPSNTVIWVLGNNIGFTIIRHGGSWTSRDYVFLFYGQGTQGMSIGSFASFPSREEAATCLCLRENAACANNLAALMWRHQADRFGMDFQIIQAYLKYAQDGDNTMASDNLKVLQDHLAGAKYAKNAAPSAP